MAVRSAITDPVIVLADRNYEAYKQLCLSGKAGLEVSDPHQRS